MFTTSSLVVELVVIGVGAASWVLLLVAAAFGTNWLSAIQPFATLFAIPALAVVYTLGIVSDRMIDALFGFFWGGSLRRVHFPDNASYHHARRTVLFRSDRMADMIEYSRSRMRICRGWTVHALLIAVAINVYCWAQIDDRAQAQLVQTFGTLLFGVLAFSSWGAWHNLTKTQYLRIREQSRFLNEDGLEQEVDSNDQRQALGKAA